MIEESQMTYAQKLRLKWLPGITSDDESKIVAELLPQTSSSFEMATLALISDFCTDERAAIIDCYLEMFNVALAANDTAELGNLLVLADMDNNNIRILINTLKHIESGLYYEGIIAQSNFNYKTWLSEHKADTFMGAGHGVLLPIDKHKRLDVLLGLFKHISENSFEEFINECYSK